MEEVPVTLPPLPEDAACERHFLEHYQRRPDGRYVVRLIFRRDPEGLLQGSRTAAERVLRSIEARMARSPAFAAKYTAFIEEMLRLGHARPWTPDDGEPAYFFPHHAVSKGGGEGDIRIVFNGSSRTPSGESLNTLLHAGPKLQNDLWTVLLRWRLFRVVFKADITKMYRQVLLHPQDCRFHAFLFRPSPEAPLNVNLITTVIYGEAPAAFLVLRVLEQLAVDEGGPFPRAVEALRDNRYVDDFMLGADDPETLVETRVQLEALLSKGCFPLAKWASNVPELCESDDQREVIFEEHESLAALGIRWSPARDIFQLRLALPTARHTRRAVLSDTSRLFDPLGFFTPVSVPAKVFLQELWLTGGTWDSELPEGQQERWTHLRRQLESAADVSVPRWVGWTTSSQVDIHAFCDASQRAVAAVVYLVIVNSGGCNRSSLLASKTKVAPVKTVSIPRLELMGAHLLTRLLRAVLDALALNPGRIVAWSDSQVVLAWIRGHPTRWKTFVANRVSGI